MLAEQGTKVKSPDEWPEIKVMHTALPGCFELHPATTRDARGSFSKLYHQPLWASFGLCTHFAEEFMTRSGPGVLRGLHFQRPPQDHVKTVMCLEGRVLDVALDLRVHSPTYRQHISLELSGALGNAIYLAPGVAHGFCVTSAEALLYYRTSSVYSPAHDDGVRWDSASIEWPLVAPLLSERDRNLPALDHFVSPFTDRLP